MAAKKGPTQQVWGRVNQDEYSQVESLAGEGVTQVDIFRAGLSFLDGGSREVYERLRGLAAYTGEKFGALATRAIEAMLDAGATPALATAGSLTVLTPEEHEREHGGHRLPVFNPEALREILRQELDPLKERVAALEDRAKKSRGGSK